MNPKKFLAELKRRNVYKVAIPVVAWLVGRGSTTFELALVLVRFDGVASFIVIDDRIILPLAAP